MILWQLPRKLHPYLQPAYLPPFQEIKQNALKVDPNSAGTVYLPTYLLMPLPKLGLMTYLPTTLRQGIVNPHCNYNIPKALFIKMLKPNLFFSQSFPFAITVMAFLTALR